MLKFLAFKRISIVQRLKQLLDNLAMSLANTFRSKGAAAVALSGLLVASSALLPFNAEAQEARSTTAPPTTQVARNTTTAPANTNTTTRVASAESTEQYQPTIITQAGRYSETNQAVSFFVLKGKKNEGGLTGDVIADKIAEYFKDRGIPVKAFVEPSNGDYTAIGYFVKGRLYGPVGLSKAAVAAVGVASDYRDAYAILPTSGPTVAAVAPSPRQE